MPGITLERTLINNRLKTGLLFISLLFFLLSSCGIRKSIEIFASSSKDTESHHLPPKKNKLDRSIRFVQQKYNCDHSPTDDHFLSKNDFKTASVPLDRGILADFTSNFNWTGLNALHNAQQQNTLTRVKTISAYPLYILLRLLRI